MLSQHIPVAAIFGEVSKLRLSAAAPRFGRLRKCGVFLIAPLAALVFNPDARADDSVPPATERAARAAAAAVKRLVPFYQDGKYGYRNEWVENNAKKEEVVIPAKFDHAGAFSEDLACVSIDGKTGFIDKTGKEIIPLQYGHAQHFSEGLAGVLDNEKGKQWGFINKTGEKVIPANYDFVFPFSEGTALVVRDRKFGLVDKTGKEVLPTKYIEIKTSLEKRFPENWMLVTAQNGLTGVVDRTGKEITSCKYSSIWPFTGGLAVVVRSESKGGLRSSSGRGEGLYGFIDETGKEVIPCKYLSAQSFSEGLAAVGGGHVETKTLHSYSGGPGYGFINKKGEVVIPLIFERVTSFRNGTAEVTLNNERFSIGKQPEDPWQQRGAKKSNPAGTDTQPTPRARDRSTSRSSTFPAPRSEFPSRR
jgi:hypothetical protein